MLKKKILLIITGSIAAYKTLYLIRLLKDHDYEINTIMTSSAKKFITPLSVSSLSGNKIYEDLFDLTDETEMGHINLAKIHDLILVVPASANFISKVACGLSDDLASSVILATRKKIFFAPSMNTNMLNNEITQKNINKLKKIGYKFLYGKKGDLACGDYGLGRMAEPETIFKTIHNELSTKPLFKNLDVLITAGPTQEPIDPVRFISNKSSGIQGYMLAKELVDQGARVSLVSGPTNLEIPKNLNNFIQVRTADEMYKACLKKIPRDLFISVAAVTDWKTKVNTNKIKKTSNFFNIKLTNNPDILKTISCHKKRPRLVVGFAAETNKLEENAIKKIKQKKCDVIIANNVSEKNNVLGSSKNSVNIINEKGTYLKYERMSKEKLAKKIIYEAIYPLLS